MSENKKTETTKNGKSGLFGFIGGVLGTAVVIGGLYFGGSFTSTTNKEVKTSDVQYNIETPTTEMVGEVKDSVVSVINLKQVNENIEGYVKNSGTVEEGGLEASGEGSGVVYKKEGDKAYIVTNNHVVAGADSVEILMSDGTKEQAEIVGTDEYSDLAVLTISAKEIKKVAEFADSDKVKVGEPAIAIGSPLGSTYASSVTQGIVSATNRTLTNRSEEGGITSINAIQTDAAINPGNSGGALINITGQVIGINSVKIAESSVEGMGFAIPSNDVIEVINLIEKDGEVKRPYLGVTPFNMYFVGLNTRETVLNLPEDVTTGVLVLEVASGSSAAKAKLAPGDVIVAIDDKEIADNVALQTTIYEKQIGDKVTVTFYRGQDKETTELSLMGN